MFLANQRFIYHNFLLCRPSQRSARSQVPSQVATHQKIGSQLWAGEILDSNPGLQDNSQSRCHWATMPPLPLSHHASLLSHHASLLSHHASLLSHHNLFMTSILGRTSELTFQKVTMSTTVNENVKLNWTGKGQYSPCSIWGQVAKQIYEIKFFFLIIFSRKNIFKIVVEFGSSS